jgi:hypothetical protein
MIILQEQNQVLAKHLDIVLSENDQLGGYLEEMLDVLKELEISVVIEDSCMGSCMAKVFHSAEWSDFKFIIQDTVVPVHKAIIATFSDKLAEVRWVSRWRFYRKYCNDILLEIVLESLWEHCGFCKSHNVATDFPILSPIEFR